jgi:SAM-dependent methyltransferase
MEDIGICEGMLAAEPEIFGAGAQKRAWLLGITPEIATLHWPQEVELIAVERVQAMIDGVWPGNTDRRRAICGDWLDVPFPDESCDLAIGDGCVSHVGFPNGLSRLLVSVHRCLRSEGYLMLRLFCRSDVAESPSAVIDALQSGSIDNFHAFKWRLAMAVQGMDDAPDVSVDEVWRIWNAAGIDGNALALSRGWRPEEIGTIDLYRGSSARYNFMRFDQTIRCLQQAGFDLLTTRTGSYELAERCPHVLLRKRSDVALAGPS